MLHPSYTELMNAVNSEVKEGEQPIVSSRYSIVIAQLSVQDRLLQVQNLLSLITRTRNLYQLQLMN